MWPPRQAPHVGVDTAAPAAAKRSSRPSSFACCQTRWVAGITIKQHTGSTPGAVPTGWGERANASDPRFTPHTNVVIDEDVVGGIRVEIGDEVIDGTVASRLAEEGASVAICARGEAASSPPPCPPACPPRPSPGPVRDTACSWAWSSNRTMRRGRSNAIPIGCPASS